MKTWKLKFEHFRSQHTKGTRVRLRRLTIKYDSSLFLKYLLLQMALIYMLKPQLIVETKDRRCNFIIPRGVMPQGVQGTELSTAVQEA